MMKIDVLSRIEHRFPMRPDLMAMDNTRDPRDYFARLFFDSCVHDAQALRYLLVLDVVGGDRVMLGTDCPFSPGEQQPGRSIDALDREAPQRARLFHDAAFEWLALPKQRFMEATA